MTRGELWWGSVSDDQAEPEEFSDGDRGRHAYLVISSNVLNQRCGYVVACPTTTGRNAMPRALEDFREYLAPEDFSSQRGDAPPTQTCVVCCDQMRVMARRRFDRKHGGRLGRLKPAALARVEAALFAVLALD